MTDLLKDYQNDDDILNLARTIKILKVQYSIFTSLIQYYPQQPEPPQDVISLSFFPFNIPMSTA